MRRTEYSFEWVEQHWARFGAGWPETLREHVSAHVARWAQNGWTVDGVEPRETGAGPGVQIRLRREVERTEAQVAAEILHHLGVEP